LVINEFNLEQNYPIPFNPTTDIRFSLAAAANVNLSIYNNTGQLIKTQVSGSLNAGYHLFRWNAKNDNGQEVAVGVYLYRITAGSYISRKKLILMM
jgi:flagellar hook assembly protein FlgD